MPTTSAIETALTDLKRHRDGLAAACGRLLESQSQAGGSLPPNSRRAALKTIQAARQRLETLEREIAAGKDSSNPEAV